MLKCNGIELINPQLFLAANQITNSESFSCFSKQLQIPVL